MKTYVYLENAHAAELPEAFRDDDVRFSESLVAYFLEQFTREGDTVLDPFAGFGTTLIVAEAMGRVPFGVEFDPARADYIRSRLRHPENVVTGDARQLASYSLPLFDFSITSPPYMNRYDTEDPFTAYTAEGRGYDGYLHDIEAIYGQLARRMKPGAAVVIEVSNLKSTSGITTLAWDVARAVSGVLHFEGETVICWDKYGYGYDHSYALVFREQKRIENGARQ